MHRWGRRVLVLAVVGTGLWTVRRVMVDRAERAARHQSWASGPQAVTRGSAGAPAVTGPPPAVALPAASPVPGVEATIRERAAVLAPRPPASTGTPAGNTQPVAPVAPVPNTPEPANTPVPANTPEPAEVTERVPETAPDPVPAEGRPHVANLDEVRERLASIRVDVPPVRGKEASVEVGASVRSRRPRRAQAWVEPAANGTCPQSHPVKVKLRSKLFHLPGMLAYERTNPDRCYGTSADATNDGFRQAKR